MILTVEEEQCLIEFFGSMGSWEAGSFRAVLGTHYQRIPQHRVPIAHVREIIAYCNRNAFEEEPPLLTRILSMYRTEEVPARFLRLIEERRDDEIPAGDVNRGPFRQLLLPGRSYQPFVDRDRLRDHLMRLGDGDLGVLIVEGGRELGKTYSAELLRYNAHRLNTVSLCELDVTATAQVVNAYGATEMARDLGIRMRASPASMPEPEGMRDDRYHIKLAEWLLEVARRSAPWWVVVDGLDHPDISRSSQQLLQNLMIRVVDEPASPISLVLLGLSRSSVPTRILAGIGYETLRNLDEADLRQYLHQVLEMYGGAEEGVPEYLAQQILERLPDPARPSHPLLARELEGILPAIVAGGAAELD